MLEYITSDSTGVLSYKKPEVLTAQKAHYFRETATDVVYMQTTSHYSPDASPLMPLVKPDGTFLTYQEWNDAEEERKKYSKVVKSIFSDTVLI